MVFQDFIISNLGYAIEHQKEVVINRTQFDKEKAEHAHILEGC